ncbi:MAG: hypothetical protein HQM10_09080 [Candidatus Riflebacteria bacterium]|nr:hypothetical protein [Candidatus Riflebacteria bacterium]
MKKLVSLLIIVLNFAVFNFSTEAATAFYKFHSLSENSAMQEFKKSFAQIENETGARYLLLHFDKDIVGITARVFVDVEPERLTAEWKRQLTFFGAAQLKITAYVWFSSFVNIEMDPNVNRKYLVEKNFPAGSSVFNYIEQWKLFTESFPILNWADQNRIELPTRPGVNRWKFDTKYTVELIGQIDQKDSTMVKETLKIKM